MLARDHYATLGVPPDAVADEIASAYRHLCRRYHPDINPGDPGAARVFERVEEAYAILGNSERRTRYDQSSTASSTNVEERPAISVRVLPTNEPGTGSYSDLFRELDAHRRRSTPARGQDIETSVIVPLAQAERGRRASIEVNRRVPCGDCQGRGRVELQHTRPCPTCHGSGEEIFVKGSLSITCPCSSCEGDGLDAGLTCEGCRGTGIRLARENLLARIPPGVTSGQVVRLPKLGHHGERGGLPGDLVVRCQVEEVEGFERHGPHLTCRVPVSVAESILGGRIELRTPARGRALLRLPPGSRSGETFRLRGRGLTLPDGRSGDLMATIDIHVPPVVDEDSKELIRRFDQLTAWSPRPMGASNKST